MEQRDEKKDQLDPLVRGSSAKQPWVKPRLAFIEPKLTPHGELTKVTGAFFGAFTPGANP